MLAKALHSMRSRSDEDRAELQAKQATKNEEHAIKRDEGGVHWFWWVFWLVVFWPAVLLVWMEHSARKRRAQSRRAEQ